MTNSFGEAKQKQRRKKLNATLDNNKQHGITIENRVNRTKKEENNRKIPIGKREKRTRKPNVL